jgi:hypothetical protein
MGASGDGASAGTVTADANLGAALSAAGFASIN